MNAPLKLLVIEDVSTDFLLLEQHLRQQDLEAECRRIDCDADLADALQDEWDAVLSDYNVPGMDFRHTLQQIRAHHPAPPVILVSGNIGEETVVELLHLGVGDFVLKDNLNRLLPAIRRCMEEADERRSRVAADAALRETQTDALEEQRQARLAALNLMEDALAARAAAEAANTQLQESEAKYRLLADSASECIYLKHPDGSFKYLSPACLQIFGRTAEEFQADPGLMVDIIHPDDRAMYRQHLNNVMADEDELEFRILHTDGGMRWIGHHCKPIQDQNGEFLGRRGVNRDITIRKQTEQELRDSEERFRIATENIRDAFILINGADGKVVLWNPAAAAMFGYGKDEALGQPIHDLIAPPRFRQEAEVGLAHFAKTGEGPVIARTLELPARHRNGREFQVELSLSATQLGGQWHAAGLIRDITERKQTEDQLRKLAQVVEQSPESIVITNRDAKIEYVNEVFLRNSGYSREEVMGQNPRILNSGKTPPETHQAFWDAMVRGETWKGEFVNKRKDGSEYVEFAIVTPIRQVDGTISHYAAVKEDITDRKRIGEELDRHRHHLEELVASRTAELESARAAADAANQAKSSFLANMSHEIRTPMNAIIGLTYLLRQSSLTTEQRERLDKIDIAAEHLLAIINDILDLSKIDAGRLELEQTDFALSAVLDHIRSLIAEKAQAKGLSIEVDSGNVPPWLRGDPTRLRQAMLNYASNAVKFTKAGTIRLRAKLLTETDAGLLIRFEVQDTGIGIAAEKVPMLFDAFVQADASITRQYGGTGLGLAITRNLANMMGGEAGVDSTMGQGSTFWFTARLQRGRGITPTESPAEKPVAAELVLRRNYAGARLLLAEDNPINREVALELLHGVGLAVDTAENGRIALRKVCSNTYDLVLMDVQMPEMDGLAATRALRARPDFALLPILAMTANAFDADRYACLAAGMNDFVAKPVNPEELYATVLRWLSTADHRHLPADLAEPLSAPPFPTPTPTPDMTIIALPGVDTSAGLTLVRGNVSKYRQLLRVFAETHREDMERVRELLAEDNALEAHRLTHNLKGVAATLGARTVSELATRLDNALRQDTSLAERTELARLCDKDLRQLSQAILALPDEVPSSDEAASDVTPERQQQILAELENLLAENNARASNLAKESAHLLRAKLGDRYLGFTRQMDVFDYEAALETLLEAKH
ncbi:MAG: PAS domain S-box protein [Methylococcaceae bacterium]|nr:PAS domain S-box protein [Methylococcaceae bacterium]